MLDHCGVRVPIWVNAISGKDVSPVDRIGVNFVTQITLERVRRFGRQDFVQSTHMPNDGLRA